MFDQFLGTILHIDDNEANRYVVSKLLRKAGFEVQEAVTGQTGLQLVAEQPPDLIILDVKLPDIDGFEVCQQIKSNPITSSIPVLHLSAQFVKSEDKAQGLEGGADAYLAQPVESIELVATVKALLRIRKAEESALALAKQWKTTFDAIRDGVCLLDWKGKVLRCNSTMTDLLEKPFSDIENRFHQELMQGMLGDMEVTPFTRAQATQSRESTELQCGKRWFSLTADPIFDERGSFIGAVYIVADITDRKWAEESLRFLKEASTLLAASIDYKTTLTNVATLAVPYIADWCAIDMVEEDKSICRVAVTHGDASKLETAEKLRECYPADTDTLLNVSQVIRTGQPQLINKVPEFFLVANSQDDKYLQLLQELGLLSYMIVPLIVGGQVFGAITFATDSSNRYYTEADLSLAKDLAQRAAIAVENARLYRQAQEANRMKDEFLTTLSHELRSPLTAMLGWIRLLNDRNFDKATTAKAMATIERSAWSQIHVVEDLLDVSRMIQGKLCLSIRPIELTLLITNVLDSFRPAAEAKNIQIESVLEPAASLITGDWDRLQQVIWNLLSNAIKFTPKDGRVQVDLTRVNSHVELRISDTGPGITPDVLPYVFDRFRQADSSSTRRYGGLGLGLSIVRHLVELHGGTVSAESEGEHKGATFIVKLPPVPVSLETIDSQQLNQSLVKEISLENHSTPNNIKVIVVDENTASREFLSSVLEEFGVKATLVSSAIEAIDVISDLNR
ncbi:MAG: ATP-binding protein [Potamolinea sp.]